MILGCWGYDELYVLWGANFIKPGTTIVKNDRTIIIASRRQPGEINWDNYF